MVDTTLTKNDYEIIIECMIRQRNQDGTLFTRCIDAKYMAEFPEILEARNKEVQKMNDIIIKLTMQKNTIANTLSS